MKRQIYITESEKKQILKQHNSYVVSDYLFECEISIDGRFLLFQDNMYDLIENKNYGYIFESIENIKMLFNKIVIPTNFGPATKFICEVKQILNSTLLNESVFNLELLKEQAKQEKSLWDKTKDWASDKINKAETILKEKGLGYLLGQSALYIGRKVKGWLWSASGMIVDAFLVASGLGKSFQWIPWAIAFVTDVYQWASGDYGDDTDFKESSVFWKILTLGFEVLGMLSAGPVALAAKKLFGPVKALKSESQIATWISKNPAAKGTLEKISNLLGSVSGKLQGLSKYFQKSFPQLSKFISGAISKVGQFITKITDFLKKIWSLLGTPGKIAGKVGEKIQKVTKISPKVNVGAGLQAATNVGLTLGAIDYGSKKYGEYQQSKTDTEMVSAIEKSDLSNYEW